MYIYIFKYIYIYLKIDGYDIIEYMDLWWLEAVYFEIPTVHILVFQPSTCFDTKLLGATSLWCQFQSFHIWNFNPASPCFIM